STTAPRTSRRRTLGPPQTTLPSRRYEFLRLGSYRVAPPRTTVSLHKPSARQALRSLPTESGFPSNARPAAASGSRPALSESPTPVVASLLLPPAGSPHSSML